MLTGMMLMANIYTLKPLVITPAVTCFIGAYDPPTKENKGFVSNVCTVDTGKSIVVIEAGPTYRFAKELNAYIAAHSGKKVEAVIVTNFHDDRYTGASYYKEKHIPIITHKTLPEELKKHPEKFTRIPKVTTKEEYAGSKVVQPDILTDDTYIIKGAARTIEILKLSKGSNSTSDIAVYVPSEDFIFVGNTVFNGRFIKYGKYSHMDAWIKALEVLEKMHVKYVMGGHGAAHGSDAYKENLDYLKLLRASVKKAYENDMDREDVRPTVQDEAFSHFKHFKEIAPANVRNYYDYLEWAE